MKLFLDSAEVSEIRYFADMGMVDGVTTNPSLIAASGLNFREVLAELCSFVPGPVSAEVTAIEAEQMIAEGLSLAEIADNIAIKVPLTPAGLKACYKLSSDGIMVNVTLCFSATQALLAAKAGATFVSPFVGRLDDIGYDGMQLIADIAAIFDNYPDIYTEVLSASIRTPMHALDSAKLGADILTVPPKVLHQMFKHPLTDIGIDKFLADWKKTGQKIL